MDRIGPSVASIDSAVLSMSMLIPSIAAGAATDKHNGQRDASLSLCISLSVSLFLLQFLSPSAPLSTSLHPDLHKGKGDQATGHFHRIYH